MTTRRVKKPPTLEDVIRLACAVQERMRKQGAILKWTVEFYPADPPKPRPEKDRP